MTNEADEKLIDDCIAKTRPNPGCNAPRIRLSEPSPPHVPGDDLVRLTFLWWDDGDPDPVIVSGPCGACTIVAVWPCYPDGRLDVPAVRAGSVVVTRWDVGGPTMRRLRDLHATFPLSAHDVLVSRDRIWPCRETLREMPGLPDLGRDLAMAQRSL